MEIAENFNFSCSSPLGVFEFEFRWDSDYWLCWATTPEGDKRQVGIYPGSVSWTGFLDYGIEVATNLAVIDYQGLLDAEIRILKWQ